MVIIQRTFNYREARNMIKSVCSSYITRENIDEYFENKFDQEHVFSPNELKSIVEELIKGKKRITKRMDEMGFDKRVKNTSRKDVYIKEDDKEER